MQTTRLLILLACSFMAHNLSAAVKLDDVSKKDQEINQLKGALSETQRLLADARAQLERLTATKQPSYIPSATPPNATPTPVPAQPTQHP